LLLASIVAWMLRSADFSTFIIIVIGRFPQLVDPTIHFEFMVLLRNQLEVLQNLTTQVLAKGDWITAEMRPRTVPFGIRARYALVVASTDISVIVPTLNEEKYLPRCLKSLLRQRWDGDFDIIVVDGGSTDRTLQIAKQYADRVLMKFNAPVGAARNMGAQAARGNVLAFIDADTIANPYWLEGIARAFQEKPTTVGVTGPTLPYDGGLSDSITYRLWTIYLQRILLHFEMPHVIGFNCAYRKTPFLSVGGFDEDNKMSEDIQLARKIRKYGKIRFEKQMSALTSARRFRKYGHVYLGGLYILTGFSTLFLNRSLSNYPPVR